MINLIVRLFERWQRKSIRKGIKKQLRQSIRDLEKRHDSLSQKAVHYEALAVLHQDKEMEALANIIYQNQMMVRQMIDSNKERFLFAFGEEV
jgi:hypothetical protein